MYGFFAVGIAPRTSRTQFARRWLGGTFEHLDWTPSTRKGKAQHSGVSPFVIVTLTLRVKVEGRNLQVQVEKRSVKNKVFKIEKLKHVCFEYLRRTHSHVV